MNLLSKQDILSAQDTAFEYVDIPEWNGKVKIFGMSLAEHIEFEKLKSDNNSGVSADQIVFVLSNGIRNEDGTRMFTKDEAKLLLNKNTSVVSKLFSKCAELSRVSTEDIKEEEKN